MKIPLSAFIVEDMAEFVQAHASYRFVIQDEEEEKPRILVSFFFFFDTLPIKCRRWFSTIDLVVQTKNSPFVHDTQLTGRNPQERQYSSCEGPLQAPQTGRWRHWHQEVREPPLFFALSLMIFCSILNKYPGFPQAEYLAYPMSICRRLAGLLRESNLAYPESLRMMTGLEVGWLQRA